MRLVFSEFALIRIIRKKYPDLYLKLGKLFSTVIFTGLPRFFNAHQTIILSETGNDVNILKKLELYNQQVRYLYILYSLSIALVLAWAFSGFLEIFG